MMLERLRPEGSDLEKQLSEGKESWVGLWRDLLASPEVLARQAFFRVWDELQTVRPTSLDQAKAFIDSDQAAVAWSRYSYTLDDIRRDLNLGEVWP